MPGRNLPHPETEKLEPTGREKYVIVLVHGTFAPNADWTQPNSFLRRHLSHMLGGTDNVYFAPYEWRGFLNTKFNNGHHYRYQAGVFLAAKLRKIIEKTPDAKHFIIAHSHGGNVALYALDSELRDKIDGLICMGTPFIVCKKRTISASIIFVAGVMRASLFVAGCLCSIFVTIVLLSLFSIPVFMFVPLGVFILPFGLVWAWKLAKRWSINFGFWVEKTAHARQNDIIKRLSVPDMPEKSIYCAAARYDEPYIFLLILQKVGEALFGLWSYRSYVLLFLIWSVATFVKCQYHGFLFPNVQEVYAAVPHWTARYNVVAGLEALFTSILLCVIIAPIHLTLLALVPRFVRTNFVLGFGHESMTDNLLANIRVEAFGDERICDNKFYTLRGKGLRHSRLYSAPQVIFNIAKWIKIRSK